MSSLFISYMNADENVSKLLERRLLDKGHRVRIQVGAAVAGNWRNEYFRALVASDVFVVVLSEDGLTSRNVLGEIGAARAMERARGMLLLPVLTNQIAVPPFISDLYCFRLNSNEDGDLSRLIEQLDAEQVTPSDA